MADDYECLGPGAEGDVPDAPPGDGEPAAEGNLPLRDDNCSGLLKDASKIKDEEKRQSEVKKKEEEGKKASGVKKKSDKKKDPSEKPKSPAPKPSVVSVGAPTHHTVKQVGPSPLRDDNIDLNSVATKNKTTTVRDGGKKKGKTSRSTEESKVSKKQSDSKKTKQSKFHVIGFVISLCILLLFTALLVFTAAHRWFGATVINQIAY